MMLVFIFLSGSLTAAMNSSPSSPTPEVIVEAMPLLEVYRYRRPRIEISGELREGKLVSITCLVSSYFYSIPTLTWNHPWDSEKKIENEYRGEFRSITATLQANIILSDKHDGLNITCSAGYPVNEGTDAETTVATEILSVSYSPRDTSVLVSPADPVSVGSSVNLTCSRRANPPSHETGWFSLSGGRLEFIGVQTGVYSFNVTDSHRGRVFFCWSRNDVGHQMSPGVQLTFKGDELVGVQVVVKTLEIVMLISTMVIFEWWFRSRYSTKPGKDTVEPDYINRVIE
ncbi:vascular cell adhesion protein 1 [Centroberyx affinis]|uniref:vascular cell adhesion protein 1 n=1 Tax=Centroberyx affinis TaxID=166261 RepID=UPI003A5BE045